MTEKSLVEQIMALAHPSEEPEVAAAMAEDKVIGDTFREIESGIAYTGMDDHISHLAEQVMKLADALRLVLVEHPYGEELGDLDDVGGDDWHAEDLFERKLVRQIAVGDTGEYSATLTPAGERFVREALLAAVVVQERAAAAVAEASS